MRKASEGKWLLHQKDLATVLGLSPRRIRQLTEMGELERDTKTEYDLGKSVQAYISYRCEANKQAEGNPKSGLEQERMLLTRTQRMLAESKLQIIRGEVHRSEDVEAVMNDMLMRFKGKLLSLPMKLAPLVVGIDDLNQLQDIIEVQMLEALAELSEYDAYEFYEKSKNRIVLGTEDEDDEEGEADDE